MKFELTYECLLVKIINHYTTQSAQQMNASSLEILSTNYPFIYIYIYIYHKIQQPTIRIEEKITWVLKMLDLRTSFLSCYRFYIIKYFPWDSNERKVKHSERKVDDR